MAYGAGSPQVGRGAGEGAAAGRKLTSDRPHGKHYRRPLLGRRLTEQGLAVLTGVALTGSHPTAPTGTEARRLPR